MQIKYDSEYFKAEIRGLGYWLKKQSWNRPLRLEQIRQSAVAYRLVLRQELEAVQA